MDQLAAVREFMLKAGQECPNTPCVPDVDVRDLRIRLIAEELDELAKASHIAMVENYPCGEQWDDEAPPASIVEAADAIADLLYVVLGAAVAWGIDLNRVFEEVHRSNMTKFIDGYRRADGKWVKGPSYTPADIEAALATMD